MLQYMERHGASLQGAAHASQDTQQQQPHLSFGSQKKWSFPPVLLKNGCVSRTQVITRRRCSVTSPRLLLYAYDSAGT